MGYCIYKICCDNIDYVYVGSTQNFTNRKSHHKTDCNNENSKNHNLKLYKTIRENGGWQNWRIAILEELGDVSKRQAEIQEERWRVELKANLNMNKAYRTEEEKKEYKKEHYEQNRDKIKEQKKEYYENNKDKLLEQKKEYYKNNKDKILEHRNEKITCECGRDIIKRHLAKHKKSKKHQEWERL